MSFISVSGRPSDPWTSAARLSAVALVASLTVLHSQAEIIDRIVAVVGGQAITWSDVRAARALGLVSIPAEAGDEAVVERLIVRELMRAEVDRFSVAPVDAAEIEAGVKAARERIGGAVQGRDPLDSLGMTEPRLRAWIEDDRRIARYLEQRFDAPSQPTDDEVLIFFQSREHEFMKEDEPQPFAAVRDEARARLVALRRERLIDEWVAGLRRRAVVLLPTASQE
jgi:hypothetical protein